MPDWKQDLQEIKGGTAIAEPNWQEDLAAIREAPRLRLSATPPTALHNDPNDVDVPPIDPHKIDKQSTEILVNTDKLNLSLGDSEAYHESLDRLEKQKPIGFLGGLTEDALFKIPVTGPFLEGLELAKIKLASIRLNDPDFDWEQEVERERRRLDWEYGRPGLISMSHQEYLNRRKAITVESARQDDIDGVTGYITAMAKREERGYNFWGRVGQGLSVLPAWMFEFSLTGGLYRSGSAPVKKLLQKHAKSKLFAKTGGWIAGSAVRTTIGMPQRVFANTMRRSLNEDEGWATSIALGWGETFIEAASEEAGKTITGGLSYVAGGAINKLPFGNKFLSALQKGWSKLAPDNTAAKFAKRIATKAGYSNLIGEYGEERLATLLHGLVGTQTFGLPEGADTLDRVLAGVKQDLELTNALSEVVVLSVPGAIKVSVGQLGKFTKDSQLQKAIQEKVGVSPEVAKKAIEIKNGEGGIEEADQYLSAVKTVGERAAEKAIAEAETPPTEAIPAPQPSIQPRKPAEAVEIPQKPAEAWEKIEQLQTDEGKRFLVARNVRPEMVDFKKGDKSAETAKQRAISIVDAIQKGQEVPPPILKRLPSGRLEVINGNARVTAYKQLGKPFDALIRGKWAQEFLAQPPTPTKPEAVVGDMTLDELKKESAVFDKKIETEIARLDEIAPERQIIAEPGISHLSQEDAARFTEINYEIARRTGISQAEAKKRVAAKRAARLAKAKPEVAKVKKPKIPPLSKETKDILGGVDPIQTIHRALGAAKAVRPITEVAKKEALRKRVGAAAGALRENLKRGMPAEQAIQLSTGLLKGPLTEYDQIYESIEDSLDPEVKNSAYLMITGHPDLRYFEVVNTQKSFQKLLAGSSITPNEATQIERVFGKAFEEQLAKVTTKSDLYDRLITYWKATLLTGLKTSGLNILSTAGHAVSETAKDIPAALIDSGVALVTGERTVAFTVKGYGTGWVEGLSKGWKYLRTGHDERNVGEKYDYKKTNFGTSKVARTIQAITEFVFHLLGAEDQPWFYGAYSRSLRSQAIAQAKTKKLKGKEYKDYISNLQKNPTDRMLIIAKEDADTAIYTNRTNLGDLGKAIQKVKGGENIVPFSRTPSAVAMQIINYSPVGVVKEIAHEIHEGKFNQRKFSQAAGRTVVGTAALYLGAQLFKAGLIALSFPKSEKERKLWELEGKRPNSIKVGDKWRDVQAFGPTGNLLVIGGYFQQALDSKGSPTEAMIEAMAGGGKSFTEQTFVRGVNLAVDALTDPERSFERWFTSMSGSLVPTIVADIARAQDDRARRAVGPKERIQSRIPIYRRGLPPKIDVFGQDLPRYGGNVLETMVDPTRPSKIRQDVVVDELRRLWDKDIKVSPTLLGDRAGYDILTKEENTQLWRRAGELTYKALFGLVNTEDYEKAHDFAKGQLVEFITGQAKAAAKAEIVNIKLKQGKTVLKLAESGLLSIDSLEALKYFQENPIEE